MTDSRSVIRPDFVAKRKRLALLLAQAAELEHAAMCMYLFASSTMKSTVAEEGVTLMQLETMRQWRAHMMVVAREEMEHLGIVLNLLSAIGEAPVLRRRNFPFTVEYEGDTLDLSLEPFSARAVRSFALLEMPQGLRRDSEGWRVLGGNDPHFSPKRFDLIAKLYDEIEDLVSTIPEKDLFIGPHDAQFVNDSLMPLTIRGISIAGAPLYNVNLTAIIDRETAVQAITQLKEEGEGSHLEGSKESHFGIFLDILVALTTHGDPTFQPARPVLSNPTIAGSGPNRVTHPVTARTMALFDMCYETLTVMLSRYFAATDETPDDIYALERAAFFPMMTTVIRPLAECLTYMPAFENGDLSVLAGPSFVLPSNVDFLPHHRAAFELITQDYSQAIDQAHALSQLAAKRDAPAWLAAQADRITQVYQVLWRSRMNLATNRTTGKPAP
jgi:Ferritin-like